jgi:hypothetical protein
MKSHRAMTRPCPVPFCGRAARHGHLLCRSCWGAVPADVQRQVNTAWAAVRVGLRMRSTRMREHIAVYRHASEAAIAAAEKARP